MATPTATANLDAGPILAPIESTASASALTSTATFTGTSNDAAKNNTKMSNLYLVTFLATLFILLLISGAIVMRSYFLRRRYQRRLEEALASGLVLAPRAQGGKRKRFGAKPGLFEVCIREPTHPTESWSGSAKYGPPSVGEKDTLSEKDPLGVAGGRGRVVDSLQWGSWETILPLSAQPIFVKRKYRGIAEPSSASPGRLINIIDPDSGGLSILAARPPPSRFLNLFGIDSEAYSVAFVSAQNASRERRAQEERNSPAPRRTDTQRGAAARMRRFGRILFDACEISSTTWPRHTTDSDAIANATPTPEPAHTPSGSTSPPTSEQRTNYELEAARVEDHLAVFGVDRNAPPPPPAPRSEGEAAGAVVVQMADGRHVVGVPVPIHVPGEDSDSEDEGSADPQGGGRAVRGQRWRTSQTTEQGVVLDAEFGLNTMGTGAAAAPGDASVPVVPPPISAPAPSTEPAFSAPTTTEEATPTTQPAVAGASPTLPTPPVKIRVEMLQIAVLIAMPTPRNCRFGKSKSEGKPPTPVTATIRPRSSSLDEDLDEVSVKSLSTDGQYVDCEEHLEADGKKEDDTEGENALPEVVLGVARVQYQHPDNATLAGGVVINADADEDDTPGMTASGTRVSMAVTSRTAARRPAATTRGGSLGGSAAFGIPG